MINLLPLIIILFGTCSKFQSETNSHLFPPGSLGSNSLSEFNVTGSLNSFVEQIQANSRSQEVPPVVQMPQSVQGRGSVIYYGDNQQQEQQQPPQQQQILTPPPQLPQQQPIQQILQQQQQPQPVIIGPQNRPTLDPALQQLLNSFNTNQMDPRISFITPQQNSHPELNTPVVSYITCYVGCSHVTNIVTNSANLASFSFNAKTISFLLLTSIIFAILF